METDFARDDGREDEDVRLAAADPSPEHRAFSAELRSLLEQAIDALPPGYREVFVLREVQGLSTAEVAETLELTDEAVKTRLHRARGLLKDQLFEKTGAAAADAFQFHAPRCDSVVAAVMDAILPS
jgi:RNA polymerase sigma-70 factor (ECF subfamily)